jgi:hypothetical protein
MHTYFPPPEWLYRQREERVREKEWETIVAAETRRGARKKTTERNLDLFIPSRSANVERFMRQ